MVRHKVLASLLFACFTGVCVVACGDDGGGDDGTSDDGSDGGDGDDGGNGGCDNADDCPKVNCPGGGTAQLCVNGGCVTDASSACL